MIVPGAAVISYQQFNRHFRLNFRDRDKTTSEATDIFGTNQTEGIIQSWKGASLIS